MSFQLTTSQGGRHRLSEHSLHAIFLSTHDLTRRSTHPHRHTQQGKKFFQLTTSQGGRLQICIIIPYNLRIYYDTIAKIHDVLSFLFLMSSTKTVILRKFLVRIPGHFLSSPHSHYKINVSVTSKLGLIPICSTLFLYLSPRL